MLTIKKLIFNPFGENTYIVWDKSKEAAIIDPGMMSDYENSAVLKFVTDNQLNLRHLINTHAHIDHRPHCGKRIHKTHIRIKIRMQQRGRIFSKARMRTSPNVRTQVQWQSAFNRHTSERQ